MIDFRLLHWTGNFNLIALSNIILILFTWIFILLLAYSVGRKILGGIGISSPNLLDSFVFNLPLGLGVLAYGIFLLGLFGLFRPVLIFSWILVVFIWSWREIVSDVKQIPRWIISTYKKWAHLKVHKKILVSISLLIFTLTFLNALSPPWEYDVLLYHLEGPRRFLIAGGIIPLPEILQANGPMLVEMLYALGITLRLDSLANLIHFSYGVLLVLATYSFGKRYLGKGRGWVAPVLLLTTPLVPILSGIAYSDIAWALYEFLALFALLIWIDTNKPSWLVLSGLIAGLAIGCKYMALGYSAILGLIVIWLSRGFGWKSMLKNAAIFGGLALLVGAPWYLKNWVWTGNPVYPLFFGGPEWPLDRVRMLANYIDSFGMKDGLRDYILLPFHVYRYPRQFGTMGFLEIPSVLFVLVFGYPFVRKTKPLSVLAFTTLCWFALWAYGSQQTRFMLPLFPGMSVLSAWVLLEIVNHKFVRRFNRGLVPGLLFGVLVSTLFLTLLFSNKTQPINYILGFESRDSFLSRMSGMSGNYKSLMFIREHLSPETRVMMMWDGQVYYCSDRCIPDSDNSSWTYLVKSTGDVGTLAKRLKEKGATHLLLNSGNLTFVLKHDPLGYHQEGLTFLRGEFLPACTKEVYRDQGIMIYELTCIN